MKNLLSLILLISSFPLFAKTYTILQGNHEPEHRKYNLFHSRKMTFTAVFNESNKYEFTGKDFLDQDDTNKLYGFSDCTQFHEQSSARFGWRWKNNHIDVMMFTHKDWKYHPQKIGEAQLDKPYEYSIEISPDRTHYIYTFNGKSMMQERGCSGEKAFGYTLYPYFGGNQAAPHDMTIEVDTDEGYGPLAVNNLYPNPIIDGKFKMNVKTFEEGEFYFNIYDMLGRKVYKSQRVRFDADKEFVLEQEIPKSFAMAMYIIQPVVVDSEGLEKKAAVTFGHSEVIKVIIGH